MLQKGAEELLPHPDPFKSEQLLYLTRKEKEKTAQFCLRFTDTHPIVGVDFFFKKRKERGKCHCHRTQEEFSRMSAYFLTLASYLTFTGLFQLRQMMCEC